MGARRVAVVREITKLHEEVRCDVPEALIEHYQEHGAPKGEIVLVIEPPRPVQHSDDDLRVMLTAALEDMGTKAAAAIVAEQTGVSKKDLYAMALELKRDGER